MRIRFLIGMLALLFFIPTTPVYAAVVINEIFPKYSDPLQEWVELYNTGTDPVSLNQWKVTETSGGKSYILNASRIIGGHDFLTVSGQDTGIAFSENGDTVTLSDDHGAVADTISYPPTLGFNTSMGRSPDGGTSWTICNTATPGKTNDCPKATPTDTPTPTLTPAPTATPAPTDTPMPTQGTTPDFPIYRPPATVTTPAPSPTPTPLSDAFITIHIPKAVTISKRTVAQIVIVTVSWILLAVIAQLRKKHPKKNGT